ncbi:hypothetical protein KXD40_007711 [Peronospora effusa]|nr:hypothetical protein KXD40_007711 [Peronospora effusa]
MDIIGTYELTLTVVFRVFTTARRCQNTTMPYAAEHQKDEETIYYCKACYKNQDIGERCLVRGLRARVETNQL